MGRDILGVIAGLAVWIAIASVAGLTMRSAWPEYASVADEEALGAFHLLSKLEGIIPALESAHAVAHAMKVAREMKSEEIVIVNLSGRGDKDVDAVRDKLTTEDTEKREETAKGAK